MPGRTMLDRHDAAIAAFEARYAAESPWATPARLDAAGEAATGGQGP